MNMPSRLRRIRNRYLAAARCAPGALALALLVSSLNSCGISIAPGGNQLAYISAGQLWVSNPDGTSAREIASGHIVSIAWSPDHHQLVYRYGNATTPAAGDAAELGAPETPSYLAVVSINGGTAVQITPVEQPGARSDAWWDAEGNRLLYRDRFLAHGALGVPLYVESQSDQPAGIARKLLLDDASLPVLSPNGKQVAVIDPAGIVSIGAPGTVGRPLVAGAALTLPQTLRPAHLLWQPHANALVYPVADASGVTLMRIATNGGAATALLTVPALLDAAFSPDGTYLLVRTPTAFEVWNVRYTPHRLLNVPEDDPLALPWWSPQSSAFVIQDAHGLRLVDVTQGTVTPLLTSKAILPDAPAQNAEWHPATGSPWNSDGTQLLFVAGGAARWHSTQLPAPKAGARGLYVATLAGGGANQTPQLIASGAIAAPDWSYPDPSTVFLVAAAQAGGS